MESIYPAQETILFTGAGFTKNYGGFLSDEMWAQIFSHPKIQNNNRLKTVLLNDFNYESVYSEIYNQKHMELFCKGGKFDLLKWEEDKKIITNVIEDAYMRLDNTLRQFSTYSDFWGLFEFIGKFVGNKNSKGYFFTLNQDLFIERYYNDTHFRSKIPTIPGIENRDWFESEGTFTAPLQEQDYCTVPNRNELNKRKKEDMESNKFFYIKIHGSQNWRSSDGSMRIVIGLDKEKLIDAEPLLAWYFKIFKDVLSQPQRKLLVIGYGFGDSHINDVISKSILKHQLKMYIINPENPKEFEKKLRDSYKGKEIWRGLSGYFQCKLEKIFTRTYRPTYQQLLKLLFRNAKP